MKTPTNLIECQVDPRVLDLAARIEPVFKEWAELHLGPEEQFDILIMPNDLQSGHHRSRMTGGSDSGGGGGKKLPVHKIGNVQSPPEGVQ